MIGEKDGSSTVDVTVVKRRIELFEELSDADYARLCKESITQEAIVASAIETVDLAKNAVKGEMDNAKLEIQRIHGIIVSGRERKELPGELRYNWKMKTCETWRLDGEEPVHIVAMDRAITDDEIQVKLPVAVNIQIHGNAETRTVTIAGKELVVLESYRSLPYSQEHFSWGSVSQETKQLAAAILLKYLSKEKAERLVDAFVNKMLDMFPKDKDLDLSIDMDAWITENKVEDKLIEQKQTKKKGKNKELLSDEINKDPDMEDSSF